MAATSLKRAAVVAPCKHFYTLRSEKGSCKETPGAEEGKGDMDKELGAAKHASIQSLRVWIGIRIVQKPSRKLIFARIHHHIAGRSDAVQDLQIVQMDNSFKREMCFSASHDSNSVLGKAACSF